MTQEPSDGPAPAAVSVRTGPLWGALWMIGGTTCFAVMAVAIRQLAGQQNAFDIAFWRSLMGTLFMLPFMLRGLRAGAFRTRKMPLMWLRAAITYVAVCAYFYAIANMVMVDAVALSASIPLFTTVLAALLLAERVSGRRWLITVVGFGGVMIILRPGFAEIGVAAMLALASGFFYACAGILIKILSRTEPATRVVFYMNLLLLVISAAPALYRWNLPGWREMPWLVAIGVCGTLAHLCVTRAFMAADASFCAPFDFWRLVLVAIAGYVLFGDAPSVWVWIGALIVFGSAAYLTGAEARRGAGAR